MKLLNNFVGGQGRAINGLASAAVILSLTACGADTLDGIQNDLANGEDVNINLSTMMTVIW